MAEKLDRRNFLVASGTVATTAVAGCLDSADGDGDETGESNDLQMMLSPVSTLDPCGIIGERQEWQSYQIHETLFFYEDGFEPVIGDLATDYEISDDYQTYTFTLKEGVTFHNGTEMTAEDVVYSWRRLAASPNNSNNSDHIVDGVMNVVHERNEEEEVIPESMEIEAVDDYTVEMTIDPPFHGAINWLSHISFGIIPEGIVGDIDGYEGEMEYEEWMTEHATGTGPFQLEDWDQGSDMTLTRFDDYHGSTAEAPEIRFQIVEDTNARYTRAVNEQNADIFQIPRTQYNPGMQTVEESSDEGQDSREFGTYGPVNGGEELQYGSVALPQTQFLQCNTLNVETAARKALAYAINQEVVAENATEGLGQPAYFVTPPSAFPGGEEEYYATAEEEYPYSFGESDRDAAREVMEEAGYSEDNPYEVTIQQKSDTRVAEWDAVVSYISDLASSIHMDVSVEQAPSGTLIGRAIEGNIDIFLNYMDLTWFEADSALRFTHPTPSTWTRWGEAETTDASEAAAGAWETYEDNRLPTAEAEQTRAEQYLTIEFSNWEDVPLIPLWVPTEQVYHYDWVEGYEINGAVARSKLNDVFVGDRS